MMLSGRAGAEGQVKGLDLRACDYLAKPFSFSELSARVRGLP
jgi:DNA-binding response OmpR family regulator